MGKIALAFFLAFPRSEFSDFSDRRRSSRRRWWRTCAEVTATWVRCARRGVGLGVGWWGGVWRVGKGGEILLIMGRSVVGGWVGSRGKWVRKNVEFLFGEDFCVPVVVCMLVQFASSKFSIIFQHLVVLQRNQGQPVFGVAYVAVATKDGIHKMAPWYTETKIRTCGLPLFN